MNPPVQLRLSASLVFTAGLRAATAGTPRRTSIPLGANAGFMRVSVTMP